MKLANRILKKYFGALQKKRGWRLAKWSTKELNALNEYEEQRNKLKELENMSF